MSISISISISMVKIVAILEKQLKDTLKNKEVLIQFLMFPVMALIMENTISIPGMPEGFFTKLFSSMYIGMAPLTAMSAIVAEEKEKNTLRVLLMSDVKAGEYLFGIGSYVWAACMMGSVLLAIAGGFKGKELLVYLAVMSVGIMISLMAGAAIGIISRTQMAATSVTVPVMMIFSFLPMIGMFNENIKKIADLTYSGQIYSWLNRIGNLELSAENLIIVGCNLLAVAVCFVIAYRKNV